MKLYEFAFLVEDFDIDNDENLERLATQFDDASASFSSGMTTVEFLVEAEGASQALYETLAAFRSAFPDSTVVRLDRDLVSMADVASRTGRSNESVRLLVTGKRGPGGFPGPIGVLSGGARVWEWASVVAWFTSELGELEDEPELIDAECAALFDAQLTTKRLPEFAASMRPIPARDWAQLAPRLRGVVNTSLADVIVRQAGATTSHLDVIAILAADQQFTSASSYEQDDGPLELLVGRGR